MIVVLSIVASRLSFVGHKYHSSICCYETQHILLRDRESKIPIYSSVSCNQSDKIKSSLSSQLFKYWWPIKRSRKSHMQLSRAIAADSILWSKLILLLFVSPEWDSASSEFLLRNQHHHFLYLFPLYPNSFSTSYIIAPLSPLPKTELNWDRKRHRRYFLCMIL